jgi:hypothetical protein
MQKKSAHPSAFSLVEISVVMVIIAAIFIGMIKSQILIGKARLSNAQALTQNTAVKDMDDMVAWFETSLETSFLFNEEKDGAQISEWLDNNPNAASRNNATQTTADFRPKFYQAVLNDGIPVVRFDGINEFMTFDGTPLVGGSYTIFVVEQRRSNSSLMMFLGGDSPAANANLHVGYRSNTALTQAHSGALLNDLAVAAYVSPTPTIHSFWFNTDAGQKYWKNGEVAPNSPDDADASFKTALTSYSGSALGRYLTNYFNGDIAEIIIFNRALQTTERQMVETYLSQKYGIAIS